MEHQAHTASPLGSVTDAEFERVALDRGDQSRVVVALFYDQETEDLQRVLDSVEEVAAEGHEVASMDIAAPDSRGTVARFALARVPMLMLFRGGTLSSIFYENPRSASSILGWIEREAEGGEDLAPSRRGGALGAYDDDEDEFGSFAGGF